MATGGSQDGSSQDKDGRTIRVFCMERARINTGKLVLYFQSHNTSGGGHVEDIEEQDGLFLVVFQNKQDAMNVLARKHDLGGVELSVSLFYPDEHLYQDASSSAIATPQTSTNESSNQNIHSSMTLDSQQYAMPVKVYEIDITIGKQRYLQKYFAKDLQNIKKDFLQEIDQSEGKIVLCGFDELLQKGIDRIDKLLCKITDASFSVSMPRACDFLKSTLGREKLEAIEDTFKCTIDVEEGLYACLERQLEIDDDRIQLIKGTMATVKADVLVNTVGQDLNLTVGSVSSSLLAVGGNDLQKQCKANYPNGIKYGDVAKTMGGKLDCKEVYHCCLPEWKAVDNMQDLQTALYKCLYQANKSGYTSIVFPALGTGLLKYPSNQVAELMFEEINKFLTNKTSLEVVAIVLYPPDEKTVQSFEERRRAESRGVQSDLGNAGTRQRSIQVRKDMIEIGNITVHIKQGDITQEDTDCIVNSTDSNMAKETGALSSAIRKKCGEELDRQCKLRVAEMRQKGFVVTTAPNLPSNFIIHVALAHFHRNWREIIKCCLKTARDSSLTSIAFPPLGTGGGSLRIESMTKILINSLREFGMKNSTIKEVRVVIFEEDKHKKFLSKLEEIIRQAEKETSITKLWKRKSKIKKIHENKYSVDDAPCVPDSPAVSEPLKDVPEQIFMSRVTSTEEEADITIYSENDENKPDAFQQIQELCQQHIIKTSFENQKIKGFTKHQLYQLKDFLKDMTLNITLHPKTGVVEVEGLRNEVVDLQPLLTNMVDNLARS